MTALRCIVLPGMDGSGAWLDEFATAMAPRLPAKIVVYPPERALGYDALVGLVRPQLPQAGPYLLLGESFSGPIAIRLAAERPSGLAGLVLCASFASTPRLPGSPLSARALARIANALPLQRLPAAFAAPWLLGRWRTPARIERLQTLLRSVAPAVLRQRLREAGQVDVGDALAAIACPLLYLRAEHDRLVSADSLARIRARVPTLSDVAFDAPHFLLQVQAAAAAASICAWAAELPAQG
ncbi:MULTISPECIES: alpha/beta fold hydrolase [Lysobacter]|uniref:Alpha/beta fold hydrolase n=1 Tax=Lysobacter firmicutimachus TaxID=1792846 RepID=A0ABU8D709_9GAMM|nr:alpha/beta fold hydrolase [Lysobacter antibioticus]